MPETGGPGAAPTLPDAVPDGVQNLLDGLFGALASASDGIGELVSGLAEEIGSAGGATVSDLPASLVDPDMVATAVELAGAAV